MRPVTVLVGGPVSAVAFQLDGKEVGRRTARPWTQDVDFGNGYEPHELVARALDAKGEEIARARQWINLPRPAAEAEILLEKNETGKPDTARLTWASRMGPKPERVTLTFDGRELPLDGSRRAKLPAYEESTAHVLTARLEFANDVRSRADLVLGGGSSGEAGSELTAVPVRFAGGKTPPLEDLQTRFRNKGMALKVTAVEHGAAEVLVVRDLDETREAIQRLPSLVRLGFPGDGTFIGKEDRLRIQWPVAREIPDVEASNVLFEASRTFRGADVSFGLLLLRVEYPKPSSSPRRFADAVAVAGLEAAASYSRRAVVLVLGRTDRDDSRNDPASVRRYLERLHVPLYVWSLAG
ncbi:MAG TPA: hypothetical protein VGL03_15710, partial [Thermoanaerobaculia bacterium]